MKDTKNALNKGVFHYCLLFEFDTDYHIYLVFICIIALFAHLNLVNNACSSLYLKTLLSVYCQLSKRIKSFTFFSKPKTIKKMTIKQSC